MTEFMTKMKIRTFAEEAKAMEYTIKFMYREKKYLEERLEKYKRDSDKYRLQMVNHFISLYEAY